MKRQTLLCGLVVLALLLCGCRDGTSNNKNAIKAVLDVKTSEYRTTTVKRGDISLRESVRVSYFASESENLSFPVSGIIWLVSWSTERAKSTPLTVGMPLGSAPSNSSGEQAVKAIANKQ